MQIKISETSCPLGKPIPVQITFENGTESAVTRDNPAKSLAVEMHLVDLRTREDLSYTMGKTTTTLFQGGQDRYAINVPPPESMEIAPGSAVVFTSDPNERLYLRPGKFDAYLTDAAGSSNHVELTIEFTRESVELLFELVQDERKEYSRREWAMDWLAKLQGDFRLKLPAPGGPSTPTDKAHNELAYARFSRWWIQNKKTPHLDEILKQAR